MTHNMFPETYNTMGNHVFVRIFWAENMAESLFMSCKMACYLSFHALLPVLIFSVVLTLGGIAKIYTVGKDSVTKFQSGNFDTKMSA